MSTSTSWHYKPTNSKRYPGLVPRDPAFLTQPLPVTNRGHTATSSLGSQRHKLGTPRSSAGQARRSFQHFPPEGFGSYHRVTRKSPEEVKVWLDELRRPTEASTHKFEIPKNTFHFTHRYISVDGTSYKWHKMDVMRDTYKALWDRNGAVKPSLNK